MHGDLPCPPKKRPKLDQQSPLAAPELGQGQEITADETHCSICLQEIDDQTVIPNCSHEFCFECLLIWAKQSRRCPLCAQAIGNYLIHNIRSKYDFSKYYLAPLRTSPVPQLLPAPAAGLVSMVRRRRTARERARERREREELDEVDKLEQSISKRRWIYRHHLYAKHVASNAFTRYKPYPSPAQFSASQDLISRTTSFVRRELQVWPNLDVEFLTTFTISIMKSIDVRSESAVKLLAEFLDMDAPYVEGRRHVNAEHFAHEIYSFVRSPYKDLFVYDVAVQYDVPSDIPPHPNMRRSRRRWRRSSPTSLESRSCTVSSRSPCTSSLSRSISPGHPSSRVDDSPISPHTRSPSHSHLRVPEADMHHSESTSLSSRHETSKSGGRDQVSRSSSLHRDGSPSDAINSGIPSLPHQIIKESEFIASSSRQRSDNLCSNDVSHRSEQQVSTQRGTSFTKPRDTVIYGKGRRWVDDVKDETFDNVQFIKTRRENTTESHSSSSTLSGAATRKLPRNQSIRESVEAHLGSGKRMNIAGGGNVNPRGKDRKSHEGNNASSIRRSSDSDKLFESLAGSAPAATGSASQSNSRDSQNYQQGTVEPKPSTDTGGNNNRSLSAQSSHQHSPMRDDAVQLDTSVNSEIPKDSHALAERLSSLDPPVIVTQETVRLKALPQEASDKDQKTQNVIDTMETPRSIESDINRPTLVTSIEWHRISGESGLHSRLSHLGEVRHSPRAISGADTDVTMADTGQSTRTESKNHAVDLYITEERLRKRAHLRKKVAAEKRKMSGDMAGQSDEETNLRAWND